MDPFTPVLAIGTWFLPNGTDIPWRITPDYDLEIMDLNTGEWEFAANISKYEREEEADTSSNL